MEKTLDRESIMWAISESRLGFEFGTPERVEEGSLAAVLPILRRSSLARTYLTFPESDKITVKDSGSIDRMIAVNDGDVAVFIRSGTIFKGGTQERVALTSNVVLAHSKVSIKVNCVHASRGIRLGADVKHGGFAPLEFDQMNYTAGYKYADQSTTWNNVHAYTASLGSVGGERYEQSHQRAHRRAPTVGRMSSRSGPTIYAASASTPGIRSLFAKTMGAGQPEVIGSDDLHSTLNDFTKSFDDVLRKVELKEDQVGLSLLTPNGCETIEVFDLNGSWRALHDDAVKRLGPSIAKKDTANVFDYNAEKALDATKKVLAMEFKEKLIHEHKSMDGDPTFRVVGLTADPYVGEVVELDGRVIHLTLLKTQVA